MPLELARLQDRLWELLTAPEGVGPALPALAKRDAAAVPLEGWIGSSEALGAVERVDIYANMYFYRLLEVLQGDYSKVSAVIGAPAFHNLITDYLFACPSISPSIRDAGSRLPQFLRTHPLSEQHPFLPDLASLEWAWVEVFDRENVAVLAGEHVSSLEPHHWGALPLQAVPALRLLQLDFNAHEIFASLERGEPAAAELRPVTLLVWRRDFQIWMRPIEPGEREALESIRAGCTFGELCEQLRADAGSDDAAARLALDLLKSWLDACLLQGPLPHHREVTP